MGGFFHWVPVCRYFPFRSSAPTHYARVGLNDKRKLVLRVLLTGRWLPRNQGYTQNSEKRGIVTVRKSLYHAGLYLSRNFATLGPFLTLQPPVSSLNPFPTALHHSPLSLTRKPKAASGSERESERPTSRRKLDEWWRTSGEWNNDHRETTLDFVTTSHSAPVRLVHSVHSSRGAVWTERMRDERERKWPTLARGSLSYLFLVSPSERSGPDGVTRGRGREESEPSDEADRASLISASLITVRLLSSSLPFPLPSVTNVYGNENVRERTVTWTWQKGWGKELMKRSDPTDGPSSVIPGLAIIIARHVPLVFGHSHLIPLITTRGTRDRTFEWVRSGSNVKRR